jgi:hypothetical protein
MPVSIDRNSALASHAHMALAIIKTDSLYYNSHASQFVSVCGAHGILCTGNAPPRWLLLMLVLMTPLTNGDDQGAESDELAWRTTGNGYATIATRTW